MTERTIKALALELAGAFYEGNRSDRFRSKVERTPAKRLVVDERTGQLVERTVMVPFFEAYPNARTYQRAHWPLFYELARQQLTSMLGRPGVSEFKKQAIFKAITEDREQQLREQARGKVVNQPHGQVTSLERRD